MAASKDNDEYQYIWASGNQTLQDLILAGKFPQVVRLKPGTSVDLGNTIDIKQPLLLYSHRRRTKVCAESFWWDNAKNEFIKEGPLLEIPKDYPGWFEIIPKDGSKIGYYGTIGGIAVSGTSQFLVRTPAVGVQISDDDTDINIIGEVKVRPGQVLTVDKVITKKWKTSDDTTLLSTGEPSTKYLRCTFSSSDKSVYLPFAHPGRFSVVAQKGTKSRNAVYKIENLMREFALPLAVRLVFGRPPHAACTFSGIMKLVNTHRPETAVICTLVKNRFQLLELPTDLDVLFVEGINETEYRNYDIVKQALEVCEHRVYHYVTSMKILENPYPHIANSEVGSTMLNKIANPLDVFEERRSLKSDTSDKDSESQSFFYDGSSEHLYDTISNIRMEREIWLENQGESGSLDSSSYMRPRGEARRRDPQKTDSIVSVVGYQNIPMRIRSTGNDDYENSQPSYGNVPSEYSPKHSEKSFTSIPEEVRKEQPHSITEISMPMAQITAHVRQVSQSASETTGDSGVSGDRSFICNPPDDTWHPPRDISSLSVRDVARSLGYIGVRETAIRKFKDEMVDGEMLQNLSEMSLKEGFTQLNEFERQKILHFKNGWRPKKL